MSFCGSEDDMAYYDSYSYDSYELCEESPATSRGSTPPPQPCDNSVVYCQSIRQSKSLLQEQLGIPVSQIRQKGVIGIVVMPIRDINLIRDDSRHAREFKHFLVIPSSPDFDEVHQDFATAIKLLNSE